MSLQDWLSVLAFVVSIVSIWLAIRESRWNHRTVVDLLSVSSGSSTSAYEKRRKDFQQLRDRFP